MSGEACDICEHAPSQHTSNGCGLCYCEEPFLGGGLRSDVRLWKGSVGGVDRLFIQCGYGARQRAKGLPSALWNGEVKAWHVPYSASLVEPVMTAFPSSLFLLDNSSVVDLWSAAGAWKLAQNARSATDLADLPIRGSGWLHQRRSFHFARSLDSSGLFLDMGGGKTLVAIGLFEDWGVADVLILCPKSVKGVWPKELAKWSLSPWDVWSMPEGAGTVRLKANALASWLSARRSSVRHKRAVIVHYDASWRSPGMAEVLMQYAEVAKPCLVLDEGHRIKSAGGKASRFAGRLARYCPHVLDLTGTPTPHGPEDIYGQYRALDPGIFGTNYAHFTGRYFRKKKINDKVEVIDHKRPFLDERKEAEFKSKMASIGIVIPREDMIPPEGWAEADGGSGIDPSRRWTLPSSERQCVLEVKTWKAYASLKKDLVAEIDEGIISADNALTKLLRLRQITSGHARVESAFSGTSEVVTFGTEKRSLLAEVLEDIPDREPVVVFGVFHLDLDAIRYVAEEAGRVYLELSGRRRDGLTAESELAGHAGEVVGVQLQSGGVGVDFTRACYFIYYSVDYNLGNIMQARDRGDRPGQSRPITEIHLVAVSPFGGATVDGVTYEALAERKDLIDAVLNALRHKEC